MGQRNTTVSHAGARVYHLNRFQHYRNSCCDLLLLYAVSMGFDIVSLLTMTILHNTHDKFYTTPMISPTQHP